MQSRFTADGLTPEGKKVLLAYELKEEEFKIELYIIPDEAVTHEWKEQLKKEWVEGGALSFPEGTELVHPTLSADSILPENIRSEETGRIRIKQNEWAYQLLTAKLWESFLVELDELKSRAAALTQYDRQLFDDAKSYWERVIEHRKERDLSQERLDKIKDEVNAIFDTLKTFRKTESAEFEAASAKLRDEVQSKLGAIKSRADEKVNYKELLDELKVIQQESRKNRYTKADEAQLRKSFDSIFQYVHDQRNLFFSDKTTSRIKGLSEVIRKMEASLEHDKKDLEYYERKSNRNDIKSMELQLIKLKTNMLQESMASKNEKLKDIYATLEKLQKQAARVERKNAGSNAQKAEESAPTEEISTDNAETSAEE